MGRGQITTKQYWDATYSERSSLRPISLDGWKNYCAKKTYDIKYSLGLQNKKVLEVGGGGSSWLAFLSSEFPTSTFVCLDYSDEGIEILRAYAEEHGLKNLEFKKKDFFDVSEDEGRFDFVYSHGVVEHFQDLPSVLLAHSTYLKNDGVMLTIIPNMAGILGVITRWLNRAVYDIHVRHDLKRFSCAHRMAGLAIVDSGYICSNNFGVLSSCISGKRGGKYQSYKILSHVSKASWYIESKFVEFPKTALFSPYLYVVSRKNMRAV